MRCGKLEVGCEKWDVRCGMREVENRSEGL